MSKYKITDKVFLIYENKIYEGIVAETKTITRSIWGIQLHNDKGNDTERETKNKYIVVLDRNLKKVTNWVSEKKLFTTLDLLMKSLINDFDKKV
jgi:hypothetical protein